MFRSEVPMTAPSLAAGPPATFSPSPSRPNRWIVLDRSWAQRLGVERAAGVYRIRRRDLEERLGSLRPECPVITPARWTRERDGGPGIVPGDASLRPTG
jgi:hypothetical protein